MSFQLFSEFRVGEKFKAPNGITYQKTNVKESVPIKDATGAVLTNLKSTFAFYNSKDPLEKVLV